MKGPPPPPIDRGWGGGGRIRTAAAPRAARPSPGCSCCWRPAPWSSPRSPAPSWCGAGSPTTGRRMPKPPILFVNTAVLLASSIVLDLSRRALKKGDRSKFNLWWTVAHRRSASLFLVGQACAWRQLKDAGCLRLDQSQQFVLLCADRVARVPPAGRRDARWSTWMCRRCGCGSVRPSARPSTSPRSSGIFWMGSGCI